MSSSSAYDGLFGCSKAIQEKFTDPDLTMEGLVTLMKQYVDLSQTGKHKEAGFEGFAYNMSKAGVSSMTIIQQKEIDKARGKEQDIVINACDPGWVKTDMTHYRAPFAVEWGAENTLYCALLPPNIESPRGQFILEKKIGQWER